MGVNDPQSSHPISESYLVEISLMTTVQQVKELRNPVFHLSLVKIKEKNWVHQKEWTQDLRFCGPILFQRAMDKFWWARRCIRLYLTSIHYTDGINNFSSTVSLYLSGKASDCKIQEVLGPICSGETLIFYFSLHHERTIHRVVEQLY